MPNDNDFVYYICSRCNVGLRQKCEKKIYKTYFHKECHEKIGKLIESCSISLRDQKIKLYGKTILKKVEPDICKRCDKKTNIIYKGVSRCFSCNVISFDPNLFVDNDEQISKIRESVAHFKTFKDIPKHFFKAQKLGFMMIFETQSPLTKDNFYLIWRMPD